MWRCIFRGMGAAAKMRQSRQAGLRKARSLRAMASEGCVNETATAARLARTAGTTAFSVLIAISFCAYQDWECGLSNAYCHRGGHVVCDLTIFAP